jgi:hypothetical protein
MKTILCIHGIGGKDATMKEWSKDWENAIRNNSGGNGELVFKFLPIDDLFTESKIRMGIHYMGAIWKFISSWVSTAIEDRFKSKGFIDSVNWYAGMPAQFATDEILRNKLKKRIGEAIKEFKPDVIFAHSLGTLITYDFFRQESAKQNKYDIVLITAGSQIGHPAMRQLFGGSILPLNITYWMNLHNENDKVFASRSIVIDTANFLQVETPFEFSTINHEALKYINHDNAISQTWPIVLSSPAKSVSQTFLTKQLGIRALKKLPSKHTPTRKALLVGINDYPDEQNRLDGCVNDVFRISEVLQEYGFSPEEIRIVLNERATAQNIRSRLKWLLEDAKEDDIRFFFYSGHGAQIPSSHAEYELDRNDECLVPYDFDWTLEHAYTDKEFLELYSQLSFKVNFINVFDCCHSGGLTRNSGIKTKGLNPPDDIRHREIKWDEKRQMWIERKQQLKDVKYFKNKKDNPHLYNGINGKTNKLGRAIPLWNDVRDREKAKKIYDAHGPFMPVIIEACGENESAFEYRHGVTSYGAFTYSLTTILRQQRAKGKKISFDSLIKMTATQLKDLDYKQNPVIVGPKVRTEGLLPFH